jgi:hypothetical protein
MSPSTTHLRVAMTEVPSQFPALFDEFLDGLNVILQELHGWPLIGPFTLKDK